MRRRRPRPGVPDPAEPLTEINMTPLIDVMLVLLIMLIITVPLQTHSVTLGLTPGAPPTELPSQIVIAIGQDGTISWDGTPLSGLDGLEPHLRQAATAQPPPILLLAPEAETPYRAVAAIMAMAQRTGTTNIGIRSTTP